MDNGYRSYIFDQVHTVLHSSFLALSVTVQMVLIPLLHNKVSPPADHQGFLLTVTHLLNKERSNEEERRGAEERRGEMEK